MFIHVGIFLLITTFNLHSSDLGLFPSKKDSTLYEINRISFSGNQFFSNDELLGVVQSRTTDLSIVHKFIDVYYEEGKKNPLTPISIVLALENALQELEKEYKFMNEGQFNDDAVSIWHFYNQHGFHEAEIDFEFYPDTVRKENVLDFKIKENERYRYTDLNIMGLDELPQNIEQGALNKFRIRKGYQYNENSLIYYSNQIDKYLKNNGYYYCSHKIDRIVWDKQEKTDSVTIRFEPGPRMKFGQTRFIDFRKNERVVTDEFKTEMVTWKEGDWYSQEKVDQTTRNLIGLGTFESVKIDTSSKNMINNDSTLSFIVVSNYRQLQSYDFSAFYNRTENNLANGGLNASYIHQNLFNNAQKFFPRFAISLRDPFASIINAITEGTTPLNDFQFQLGMSYSQPFLWLLNEKNDMRSGFSFDAQYARRNIRQFFDLEDINASIGFPTTFKQTSDVTRFEFSFIVERQQPLNFDEFLEGDFQTPQDSIFFRETLLVYDNINEFVKNNNPIFTSTLLNFNILGDKRNNPFAPTKGWRVNLVLEPSLGSIFGTSNLLGLSEYAKFNASYFQFWSTSPQGVVALKLLAGGILFRNDRNNYIPLNKQFFAGGPNSIRGWPSRQLRYTTFRDSDLSNDPEQVRFLKDFVGNQALFESSLEFRFTFLKPDWAGETLGEHIASSGLTFFFDFGNAFGWLIPGEDNTFEISDIEKLAWAGGVGYRYNTPVGPVRLDFGLPIYGPIDQDYEFISQKTNLLSYVRFHIGLGHAF